MTNRKYRVVCMLNTLERQLRILRGQQGDGVEFERTFLREAEAIQRAAAKADLRYVRGRLEFMLEEAGSELKLQGVVSQPLQVKSAAAESRAAA